MSKTPNSVFLTLLEDIEPSPTTKGNASAAHTALRDHLKGHATFKDVHMKTFLSGSYKRDTAIRPRTINGNVDRPDVDIIQITNHALTDSPSEVLDELFKAVKDGGYDVRKQQRSVGVTTANAEMDVVPIIAPYGEDGPFYIPDRKLEEWVETNPPRHTSWTTETNDACGKRFKPLVKLVKWWRRENPTVSMKPKGFVLECITAECMSRTETHYGELFVGTLDAIVVRYQPHIDAESLPWITDPGVPSKSVTDGMTFAAFKGFFDKVKALAAIGHLALDEEDADKATDLWRKLFGDRFPKISTTTAKSLMAAAATVTTPSFPDNPVRPSKPGGFA